MVSLENEREKFNIVLEEIGDDIAVVSAEFGLEQSVKQLLENFREKLNSVKKCD